MTKDGRRRGEAILRDHWEGSGGIASRALTAVTAPLSALFGVGVRARGFLHDRDFLPVRRGPIPVVSVGNLSVGGTGKTPVTRWVVGALLQMGHRPAIVARGYGEDELALHRRWHPDLPVVANPDRPTGVEAAAEAGATVAVLDDGFQHRRLARELDIVLVSAAQPFPPRLLPRGPYREPLSSLKRAHVVLVTARIRAGQGQGQLARARLRADELRPHMGPGTAVDVLPIRPRGWQDLEGRSISPPTGDVLAACSVADPEGFRSLAEAVLERPGGVDLAAWPDHHPYDEADLHRIVSLAGERTVITTEKDAVKLMPLWEASGTGVRPPAVLAIEARPGERLAALLRERLAGAAPAHPPTGGGS